MIEHLKSVDWRSLRTVRSFERFKTIKICFFVSIAFGSIPYSSSIIGYDLVEIKPGSTLFGAAWNMFMAGLLYLIGEALFWLRCPKSIRTYKSLSHAQKAFRTQQQIEKKSNTASDARRAEGTLRHLNHWSIRRSGTFPSDTTLANVEKAVRAVPMNSKNADLDLLQQDIHSWSDLAQKRPLSGAAVALIYSGSLALSLVGVGRASVHAFRFYVG